MMHVIFFRLILKQESEVSDLPDMEKSVIESTADKSDSYSSENMLHEMEYYLCNQNIYYVCFYINNI